MKHCVYAKFSGKSCRSTGSFLIGSGETAILEMQLGNYLCKKHVIESATKIGLKSYTEVKEKELNHAE